MTINKALLFLMVIFLTPWIIGCSYRQVDPVSVLTVDIGTNEPSEFVDFIYRFSAKTGFSVQNHGDATIAGDSGRRLVLIELSRYRDDVRITITDLRDGRRFTVAIFDTEGHGDWKQIHEDLASTLATRWRLIPPG